MIKKTISIILIASIFSMANNNIINAQIKEKNNRNNNYINMINNNQSINSLEDTKVVLKEEDKDNTKAILSDNDKMIANMNYINNELNKLRNELMAANVNNIDKQIESINRDNNRKDNIIYNEYDITQISHITANELYNVLIHINNGKLADYAWTFKECEDIYGINAFFLVGLVAQESGWVTSNRSIYQNNLTGYAVYNDNSEGVYFNTKEDSIYSTAKLLKDKYLTYGAKYYRGKSIWNINSNYCYYQDGSEPNYSWSDYINQIANQCINYYHDNIKVINNDDIDLLIVNRDKEQQNIERIIDNKRKELLNAIK